MLIKTTPTLKDVCPAVQPYNTTNTQGSPSEHFIHSFQFIPDQENTSIFLLFKNRAGAAHKQMENSYNYWLQVLQKLNPFAVLPFKMHGNKATEISIQWSLKSSLPAQNVKINHHTLYHQQSYFFSSVMTTRIMTVTKANYYCLHYYSWLFRVSGECKAERKLPPPLSKILTN